MSAPDNPPRSTEDGTEVLQLEDAPIRVRKLSLVISRGPDAGRRIALNKDRFVVGKSSDCDLKFLDPTVSRRHFEIEKRGDTFVVRDLGSTNGTTVDGIKIKEAFLSPGSKVAAGNVELIFQPVYEMPETDALACESFGSLVAANGAMKNILGLLRKAATTGTTVLLQGETGVGKSALAKAIHEEGPRKTKPFTTFDCASVPPTLIESELFGAKKGAFTGAVQSRPGACEQAQGGTLFLDEIGDLPLELQPKLLRVLEEKEVSRLGDTKSIKLDIHVVVASKVDLRRAIKDGRFRRDLYYRVAVLDVEVPPLRKRPEDISLLVNHFLQESKGSNAWARMAPPLREEFENYPWPGNLRELRNVLERIQCIGPDGFPKPTEEDRIDDEGLSLAFDLDRPFKEAKEELIDTFEMEYLQRLLDRSNGRIAPAAREAGLNRKYFYDLLRKHGLQGRK
jgi:DNA-binding NtrC family response regulator